MCFQHMIFLSGNPIRVMCFQHTIFLSGNSLAPCGAPILTNVSRPNVYMGETHFFYHVLEAHDTFNDTFHDTIRFNIVALHISIFPRHS